MTTEVLTRRDKRAEQAIQSSIVGRLSSPAPRDIKVTPQADYSGEPALYVYVEMPTAADIPDESLQNMLTVRALAALLEIDDERFPHLFFGPRPASDGDGSGSPDGEDW